MEATTIVREELIAHRLPIYVFLQKFYKGHFNHISRSTWEKLIQFIFADVSKCGNEKMQLGMKHLQSFKDLDVAELEYDFNRLFVGPNRLEASPFESTYRNKERAVMQRETLAVRRFYETAGLMLLQKNNEPDDHLAFELEFICHLLEESLENDDSYYLYQQFLKKHLFHWVEDHCELIREKTKNNLLMGVSYLLQGLIEEERIRLNVRRRLKK